MTTYKINLTSWPCISCGKLHCTVLENSETGEILKKFERCRYCLLENSHFPEVQEQIELTEEVHPVNPKKPIN